MKALVISALLFCCCSTICAQPETKSDSTDIFQYNKDFFLSAFFPKGIAEGVALRSYLRSSAWDEYRKSHSDLEAFDELFDDADELCHDNRTAGVLASAIAVLDHKTIPLKLFFGIVLQIPLTIESQSEFDTRTSKLPVYLYDPNTPDRDKLQHFLFSAYFTRTLKMNWLLRLLGNAVEVGEDLFIIGGSNDERDKHANNDGIRFGESCDLDSLPMPSTFLTKNP